MRTVFSRLAVIWLTLWALCGPVMAQAAGPSPNKSQAQTFVSYTQIGRAVDITATTASQDEVLGAVGPVVTVYNEGSVYAYIGLTNAASTITAAAGIPVPPGACTYFNAQNMTHIQAITASSTALLQVSIGWGNIGCGGGGGSSGGGSSGAVFGPTAVGSAIANPPVVIGGSQNGLAGGSVGIWKVDSTGLGYINCANCSGSGASAVDSSAFASGTSVLAPSGGVFNDALSALSSGTQGTERMTSFRAQHVNLRNNSGTEIGTSANPVQVSLANTAANGTAVLVTGTGGTFPVSQSGTWNITNISGTVSLPTGASTSALQPTNAAAGSTSAGQTGNIEMGAVTTGSPAYTTGQTNFLSLTTAGALRVDGSATTQPVSGTFFQATQPVSVASGQVVSGAYASGALVDVTNVSTPIAPAAATATKGVLNAMQFNSTQATFTNGQQGAVQGTARGALYVAVGADGFTISNTNFIATQVTAANLNATVVGTGTFAVQAAQTGTWNITNISGTVSLPTGASTSALQPTNAAAGSTTSGQTGNIEMGAVTTAAPSYTTAQTNFLSLTVLGGLRTDMASIAGTATSTGAGAVGTGSQRVAVGQDTTTIAGSAPGTAGTPSTNVVTVQGPTSGGTAIPVSSADGALTTIGAEADSAWVGTGSGSVVAILKALVSTASQSITISGSLTNPVSTLTMTSATTAYTAGQLIANNATAGSITTPSFVIATPAGGATIARLRLSTNDTTSTAWGAQTIQVDLWSASPTWTNGDRGTWLPATGTASHLGTYTCVMSAVYGDGVYSECSLSPGNFLAVKLASGSSVFWSLKSISGSGVTGASKVFTLVPEVMN